FMTRFAYRPAARRLADPYRHWRAVRMALAGVLLPLVLLTCAPPPAVAQEDAADVDRLVQHLQVRPGMRIGEIGAGDGGLTVALAKAVGPNGHVFSNEISEDRRAAIRTAVERAGLANVTVVES